MSHEILSVKLCQLDDKISRLHSRIHMSETAGHAELRREIAAMKQEYAESETVLREKLRHSKSEMVSILDQGYRQMEQIVRNTEKRLRTMADDSLNTEAIAEEKILLAEYALDFAMQAANLELLVFLEAIKGLGKRKEIEMKEVKSPKNR